MVPLWYRAAGGDDASTPEGSLLRRAFVMALSLTGMMEKELSSSELSVLDRVRSFIAAAVGAELFMPAVNSGEPLRIGGRDMSASLYTIGVLSW
jgi:hypothetical protein